MNELVFKTLDHRFGLRIEKTLIQPLQRFCQQSLPNETGGIILGFYSAKLDYAIITSFANPPEDSQAGRAWFYRGIKGLQTKLNQLWQKRKHYYLGEWHFHPYGTPDPSPVDIAQMYRIATDTAYVCPEPILIIFGGDPYSNYRIGAYIFQQGNGLQDFIQTSI